LVELLYPGDIEKITDIMDQWDRLTAVQWELAMKNPKEVSEKPEKFWFMVLKHNRVYDEEKKSYWSPYGQLALFALEVLTLPHSNGTVERLFSIMNLVKTKLTNRLMTAMLNAILMTRFALKVKSSSVLVFCVCFSRVMVMYPAVHNLVWFGTGLEEIAVELHVVGGDGERDRNNGCVQVEGRK
jgi:hypothetical protein